MTREAQAITCSGCNAKVGAVRDHLVVGPHTFCSTVCRNSFLPVEHKHLRAAVLHALPYVRSKRSKEILLAGLRGEFKEGKS